MKIEIYYWKSYRDKSVGKGANQTFVKEEIGANYLHDKTPTIANFHSDYVKLPYEKEIPPKDVNIDNIREEIKEKFIIGVCSQMYTLLNSPSNPLGYDISPESQEFIRENKLHTSMSVGDIISFDEKEFWIVRGIGFDRLWN